MKVFQDRKRFPAVFLLVGFLVGIFYANMMSEQYAASGIFQEYFLNQYVQTEIITADYMWYIMKARVLPFLIICLLGCTKRKKILVGCVLGWTGFSGGMVAVSAVIRLGMKGLALCVVGIFPQVIFYVPAYSVQLIYLYRYPEARWNTGKTIFIFLAFATGILLEAYVNPILLKAVIKTF